MKKKPSLLRSALTTMSLTLVFGTTAFAQLADSYSLTRLGLLGQEFTRSDGHQETFVNRNNSAGFVAGTSIRFNNNDYYGGRAWLFDGSSTRQIGLGPQSQVVADPSWFDKVQAINVKGQAAGTSTLYTGSYAWLYSNGQTQKLGLTGSRYIDSHWVKSMNQAGQVVGNSMTTRGRDAWLFDGTSTQRIGLTGTIYTSSYGAQIAEPLGLNAAGQVIGESTRFQGINQLGVGSWLHSGGLTQSIGLTGNEHTRHDGFQYSRVRAINDAGQVIGTSQRLRNGAGQNAWFFDGSSSRVIGLTGPSHTSGFGIQVSKVISINSAGQVIGTSARYGGFAGAQDAWIYSNESSRKIGLVGPSNTRSDGNQVNTPLGINEAGQVVGEAQRFLDDSIKGTNQWFYNGTETTLIGLVDARHTSLDSTQQGRIVAMNRAGQVIGVSDRFQGGVQWGQTAWFYDDDLNQTFELTFSEASNGFANSVSTYLTEDGLVLGTYDKFELDRHLGTVMFAWTREHGMIAIDGLVADGVQSRGIYGPYPLSIDNNGSILLIATTAAGGSGAFVLSPVPEPSHYALTLAGFGVITLSAKRKRRAAKRTTSSLT